MNNHGQHIAPRPVQKNIPPTPQERRRLLEEARTYVAGLKVVPPVGMAELSIHAERLMTQLGCHPIYRDYVSLLVNNELWRGQLAGVPFERRLLLLPKCLRVEAKCPASFDQLGLLCENCGLCPIQDLAQESEALGYAVLVAEGSAVVMNLIKSGKIEAVIGVSCMNVLRKAFPHMEAGAVPGIAIPLLQDDCADTSVDLDWIWEYIQLTADKRAQRLNLGQLRQEASALFSPASLDSILGPAQGETERIAREWLGRAGKRWRPFLTLATRQALTSPDHEIGPDLQKVAVAVECFHKASLIHDDIEDNDASRYGEKTLHEEYGMPVALNVGDLLIGEGYRLLSACDVSAEARLEMLHVASEGQRELCRGQGAELTWSRTRAPLDSREVLEIFRKKTAPAFEVALRLGAILSGAHSECSKVIGEYSDALGIAYQIHDDLSDFGATGAGNDIAGRRPSLVLAVARERAQGPDREFLDQLWRGEIHPESARVESLCRRLEADQHCEELLTEYKQAAIGSLSVLERLDLKALLRRVIGRIFNEIEFSGWCGEKENKRDFAK